MTGSDFGPLGEVAIAEYGPEGGLSTYQTTCVVVTAHTSVQCKTVSGVGAMHLWRLTVAGRTGPWSSFTTSYARPFVSSVALLASADLSTKRLM